MASCHVDIECTPSPATLSHSKSFPVWPQSSPTLSSWSSSESGPEKMPSSPPPYSRHGRQSVSFSFPLPPLAAPADDIEDERPQLEDGLDTDSDDDIWEINIALHKSPNQDDADLDLSKHDEKGDEPVILQLELSPVQVAQLFNVTIETGVPPQISLDHQNFPTEITIEDLYKGIEVAIASQDSAVGQDRSPLDAALGQAQARGEPQEGTSTISGPPAFPPPHESGAGEAFQAVDIATLFKSPELSTPDLELMPTPVMMDSWPTPVLVASSANQSSIARLLQTTQPVEVAVSDATMLERARSEKGVLEDRRAKKAYLFRQALEDPCSAEQDNHWCDSPAMSVLHRPRAKPRRDATSFFGTSRRDQERKIAMERALSKSSVAEGCNITTSQSLNSIALPSTLRQDGMTPSIPTRKSSQGCLAQLNSAMRDDNEDQDAVTAAGDSSRSTDGCTYHMADANRVHDNDSSPAAFWDETRQMLNAEGLGKGAGTTLLDELRRQHASTLNGQDGGVPSTAPVAPSYADHGVIQQTAVPVTLLKAAPMTAGSTREQSPTQPRTYFGGHIIKAFRRSPRSAAGKSVKEMPTTDAPVATSTDTSSTTPMRSVLIKPEVKDHNGVARLPSASRVSFKTASSGPTKLPNTPSEAASLSMTRSSVSTSRSSSPHDVKQPTVLKEQALQDVKQICQQEAALIRAAAMVAAAEEQRAAATAAYRAAEEALLASRRQSAIAQGAEHGHGTRQLQQPQGDSQGDARPTVTQRRAEHEHIAQILFAQGVAERRHDVPSIRPVRTPASMPSTGNAPPGDKLAGPSNTVVLSF